MENTLFVPDRIVSVSEFSQGKAGKVFRDVKENRINYMVMKNNNPVALIVPYEEYISYQERINMLESKLAGYLKSSSSTRIGIAKGRFEVPDDFDEWDIGFKEMEDEDIT